MSLPISFVMVVYREEKYLRARACIERLGAEDIVVIRGSTSLFASYDDGWRQARHDIVCFLHEDAEVEQLYPELLMERLRDPKTGFLGVAGARVLNADAVWWQLPDGREACELLSGVCGHCDDHQRWFNIFGPFSRVVVLDGVCLFARKDMLEQIGGFADPPLNGFDFYDISATFRAHLAGYRNYTVPVRLFHWGLGYPRESWEYARQIFLQKYATHLPAFAESDYDAVSVGSLPNRP